MKTIPCGLTIPVTTSVKTPVSESSAATEVGVARLAVGAIGRGSIAIADKNVPIQYSDRIRGEVNTWNAGSKNRNRVRSRGCNLRRRNQAGQKSHTRHNQS